MVSDSIQELTQYLKILDGVPCKEEIDVGLGLLKKSLKRGNSLSNAACIPLLEKLVAFDADVFAGSYLKCFELVSVCLQSEYSEVRNFGLEVLEKITESDGLLNGAAEEFALGFVSKYIVCGDDDVEWCCLDLILKIKDKRVVSSLIQATKSRHSDEFFVYLSELIIDKVPESRSGCLVRILNRENKVPARWAASRGLVLKAPQAAVRFVEKAFASETCITCQLNLAGYLFIVTQDYDKLAFIRSCFANCDIEVAREARQVFDLVN